MFLVRAQEIKCKRHSPVKDFLIGILNALIIRIIQLFFFDCLFLTNQKDVTF